MAQALVVRSPRRAAWIILFCFFASGMSGLIYQVIWVRELVLVFGATTFAVSTVLTAFMGGLALGSFVFGRRSAKITRPLRLYGLLEIGIGVYGLAVPFIFEALPGLYHPVWKWLHLSFFALSLVRFLLAALVLVLPTALMGATLPVLSNYYARDHSRIGFRVGSLYSLNTFGAVLGAATTGFILIPVLGMTATTITAAAINIILGCAALAVSRQYESAEVPEEASANVVSERASKRAKDRRPTPDTRHPQTFTQAEIIMALVGFALSGFIALCYEVIWSRVLALIIGSSVYAFSIMLTTFLIGLALGASLASRVVDRIRRPVLAFAVIEIGVGVTSLIGAYLFNDLPYVFVQIYRWLDGANFGLLVLTRFLVASLVMIAPTLLLGAIFPLVVRIVSKAGREHTTGRTVGDAYAANTVGAIAGSFISGFVLIPWLGLLGSLKVCVALNFVVAGALFLASGRKSSGRSPRPALLTRLASPGLAASALLVLAVILMQPPWDSEVMSSAVYRYAPSMAGLSRQELGDYLRSGQGETLFYEEGITATVAVQKQGGGRVLKVNGKPEASTAGDMPTQILIGSLPLLVREKTDDVLVIGLGSGITLGSVQQFPVKSVTCVELEPAVIEASRHFDDVNHRPLEDPRLRMIANDGRNFIFTTDEKFDVIVSQPSNPWLTGVANLFTLEYFRRGAEKLTDDGVFSQWLQIYEMSPDDLRILVATFRAAFPHAYLFRGAEGDLMLLGSKKERPLDLQVIRSHFYDPKIAADHKPINTDSETDILSRFYFGTEEIARFCAGAPLNTDDNALIEFSAPRRVGAAEETVVRNVKELLAYAASPVAYLSGAANHDPALSALLTEAALNSVKRKDTGRAEQFISYALDLAETAQARSILGELRGARGDETGAIDEWQAALALDPNHFYTLINLGKVYLSRQDAARAAPYLDRAIALQPDSARANHLRGLAWQAAGHHERAALAYRKALPDAQYTRGIPTYYLNFGTALTAIGLYEEAAQILEEYTRLAPKDFEGHYQLGVAYEIMSERTLDEGLTQRAIDELKLALSLQPRHAMSHYYLSKAYRRLEMYDEADAAFELYERLMP